VDPEWLSSRSALCWKCRARRACRPAVDDSHDSSRDHKHVRRHAMHVHRNSAWIVDESAPRPRIQPRSYSGAAGGPNAIMFPRFAMSGGCATTLGLVNNTSSSISGRIDIFDSSGNPMVIPWNCAHNSTFKYSIPPVELLFSRCATAMDSRRFEAPHCFDKRDHTEFLLMLRLAFRITHNVSASDNVSAQRLWVPKSRSAFVPAITSLQSTHSPAIKFLYTLMTISGGSLFQMATILRRLSVGGIMKTRFTLLNVILVFVLALAPFALAYGQAGGSSTGSSTTKLGKSPQSGTSSQPQRTPSQSGSYSGRGGNSTGSSPSGAHPGQGTNSPGTQSGNGGSEAGHISSRPAGARHASGRGHR